MKKPMTIFLFVTLILSMSCQTFFPASPPPRAGTVITNCVDITKAIRSMQTSEVPQGLYDTGIKQGDEFDVNDYFTALPNLSMREGYALDYVFLSDSLGSFPLLVARPTDQPPYVSSSDISIESELANYWKYIEIKDLEQGYFEFTSFIIMADQFYLVWHANYDDTEIVCDRNSVDVIVAERNNESFGIKFDNGQMRQIRAMNNIEPLVRFKDMTAIVEIVTFTKWGGFFRMTYTIDRAFPHTILDVQEENIVPYDCGILF